MIRKGADHNVCSDWHICCKKAMNNIVKNQREAKLSNQEKESPTNVTGIKDTTYPINTDKQETEAKLDFT